MVGVQGEVEIEDRDVGGAGFDDAGAFHGVGEVGHGAVDFFIHFNESQVDVGSIVEMKGDHGVAIAGFGVDICQVLHLHQLLPEDPDRGVFQFAGRCVLAADVNGDLRDVHIGHQGYGQPCGGDQTQDQDGDEGHGDGDGAVDEEFYHFGWLFSGYSVVIRLLFGR